MTLSFMPQRLGERGRYDPRELRDAAIEALVEIVTEPTPPDADRSFRGTKVSAAARLLSHTEWLEERSPESQFFKLFATDADAARYLTENHDRLLTLAGKSSALLVGSDAPVTSTQTENSDDPQAEHR